MDKPIAFMWQHDETGRTGFVDAWQVENGWQANNPRLAIVSPLYAAPPATGLPPLPPPDRTMWQYGQRIDHFTAEQMKDYALSALSAVNQRTGGHIVGVEREHLAPLLLG